MDTFKNIADFPSTPIPPYNQGNSQGAEKKGPNYIVRRWVALGAVALGIGLSAAHEISDVDKITANPASWVIEPVKDAGGAALDRLQAAEDLEPQTPVNPVEFEQRQQMEQAADQAEGELKLR